VGPEDRVRLSLVQALSPESEREALVGGLAAVDAAAEDGADLVLFPELFSLGYRLGEDFVRRALSPEGPWVRAFADRAALRQVAVAVTYLESHPGGAPFNAVTLFDRRGTKVLHYRKVHLCGWGPEGALSPGDGFPVAVLDTAAGPVPVGAMICFDREFPESARQLALAGAELVLVPNACELEANRQGQIASRAFENSVVLAVANYAGPGYLGGSTVVSPQAFTPEGASRNPVVARAGAEPDLVTVDLDLGALRAWRRDEVWNGRWRRPEAYRLV